MTHDPPEVLNLVQFPDTAGNQATEPGLVAWPTGRLVYWYKVLVTTVY